MHANPIRSDMPPSVDPMQARLLLDSEQLCALVGERALRDAVALVDAHAVMECTYDDGGLFGYVEGADGEAHSVEVIAPASGESPLSFHCTCADGLDDACAHPAALLLAHGRQIMQGASASQAAQEVAERMERGRREVIVRPMSADGRFGLWNARTTGARGPRADGYTVHVRSLDASHNFCECPDFAVNQLGTCKHIEAVLHRLRKAASEEELEALVRAYPSAPFVGLGWTSRGERALRVHGLDRADAATARLLSAHFDDGGWLRATTTLGGAAMIRALDAAEGAQLAPEARAFVDRALLQRAREDENRRIESSIRRSGGHLEGVRARLYPYQVDGVAFLASRGRALLADDMGLGKTLQTIAAAHWLHEHAGLRTTLIVCPASLKTQWAREIAKFTSHKAVVVQGGAEMRLAQYRRGAAFTVVNYELVLRDWRVLNETLGADLVVLDEAQRIRNWRTKLATAVKSLAAERVFVLSGTPLENRIEDLYSLMQAIDPTVLGPLWRYLSDFQITDELGRVVGHRNLGTLRQRLSPVMLRRDRRLVASQLPNRVNSRIDVSLSHRQRDLHDEALNAAAMLARIRKRRPLTPSEEKRLLAALQNARMACNAAGLVDKTTVGAPKLDLLRTLLDELCRQHGRKVVVFSQWERMTAMAEATVRSLGLGCVRLHGGVPSSQRGALIERFETDDGCAVFLSTDAGATGLNLQAASVVVHLDIPYNPAVLEQRTARIHRLGQSEPVLVVTLIAGDAYEGQVASMLERKRALFDAVVDPESTDDVVGLSKSAIATLIEALDEQSPPATATEGAPADCDTESDAETESATSDPAAADATKSDPPAEPPRDADSNADEGAVRAALVDAENAFAGGIDRVVAQRNGLLLVLHQVPDAATVQAWRSRHPDLALAALDASTAVALEQLGLASPAATLAAPEAQTASGQSIVPPPTHPLKTLAHRKLAAGEALLAAEQAEEATACFATAMLAAIALRGEQAEAPPTSDAAVWLYASALPRGWCSAESAAATSRAIAFASSPHVPLDLAHSVAKDAQECVATSELFDS